jgi:hypothetical protein
MSRKPMGEAQTALVFLGVMVALAAIGGGAGLLMQAGFSRAQKPPALTTLQTRLQTPPEPRLQVDPLADRQVVLGPERLASTYGWTDQAKGRARIPVDAAMRLLAQRGWPSAEAGQ